MCQTSEGRALRLEGELMGPWVVEVKKACEPYLDQSNQLTLDLAEVMSVDRTGIALLRELKRAGVMMVNGSPFLIEQLKIET